MAYREFVDENGERWKVWDVTPDEHIVTSRAPTPPKGFQKPGEPAAQQGWNEVTPTRTRGWLAFQSGKENRRLSPIPPNWENADEEGLVAWLHKANPVQNRYRA